MHYISLNLVLKQTQHLCLKGWNTWCCFVPTWYWVSNQVLQYDIMNRCKSSVVGLLRNWTSLGSSHYLPGGNNEEIALYFNAQDQGCVLIVQEWCILSQYFWRARTSIQKIRYRLHITSIRCLATSCFPQKMWKSTQPGQYDIRNSVKDFKVSQWTSRIFKNKPNN